MNGTGKHHVNQKNSDSESQGLYNFSHRWKLERIKEKRNFMGKRGKVLGDEIDQIMLYEVQICHNETLILYNYYVPVKKQKSECSKIIF